MAAATTASSASVTTKSRTRSRSTAFLLSVWLFLLFLLFVRCQVSITNAFQGVDAGTKCVALLTGHADTFTAFEDVQAASAHHRGFGHSASRCCAVTI